MPANQALATKAPPLRDPWKVSARRGLDPSGKGNHIMSDSQSTANQSAERRGLASGRLEAGKVVKYGGVIVKGKR